MNCRFCLVILPFIAAVSISILAFADQTISDDPNYLIVSDQTGAFDAIQDYNQINEDEQKEIDRLRAEADYSIVLERLDSLWSRLDGKNCRVQSGWSIPVRQALATGRDRTLTEAELNQYRARFDLLADAISESVSGSAPDSDLNQSALNQSDLNQSMSWRQTIDLFPASTAASQRASCLAELYYQRGEYLPAVALWNRLIADPLFPLSAAFLQANAPDSAAVRDLLGPKISRSESLQSSDAEIEARVAASWIRWLNTNDENQREIAPELRPDWLKSPNGSNVAPTIADRFLTRYAKSQGRMAGKSIVLADFLRQTTLADRQGACVPKSPKSYTVDSQGIWQIDSGKTVLIYKDECPDAIRGQYLPAAFSEPTEQLFPYTEIDGVVIARVGTPIIGQNLNRRTPDGLTNRLVCVDTNQGNTVRWERLPQSPAARWTGAGLYQNERLYVLEFVSGYPAQLYLNCLDAASGELLWRRYLASGSAIAAGEKPLIGHFDPKSIDDSTILVPLSAQKEAWNDLDHGRVSYRFIGR